MFRRRLSYFIDSLRSPFAWRYVNEAGVWAYYENAITGKRRAVRISSCCGPQHYQWLDGGAWEAQQPTPPRGGSAVQRPSARND